jgi:hypothetical protein
LAGIELEAVLAITLLYDAPCGAHTKNECSSASEVDLRPGLFSIGSCRSRPAVASCQGRLRL